jgi:hypothetical protein
MAYKRANNKLARLVRGFIKLAIYFAVYSAVLLIFLYLVEGQHVSLAKFSQDISQGLYQQLVDVLYLIFHLSGWQWLAISGFAIVSLVGGAALILGFEGIVSASWPVDEDDEEHVMPLISLIGGVGFVVSGFGLMAGAFAPGPLTGLILPVGLGLCWVAQVMLRRSVRIRSVVEARAR